MEDLFTVFRNHPQVRTFNSYQLDKENKYDGDGATKSCFSAGLCLFYTCDFKKQKQRIARKSHVPATPYAQRVFHWTNGTLLFALLIFETVFSGAVMTPCEQPPGPPVTRLACERDGSLRGRL